MNHQFHYGIYPYGKYGKNIKIIEVKTSKTIDIGTDLKTCLNAENEMPSYLNITGLHDVSFIKYICNILKNNKTLIELTLSFCRLASTPTPFGYISDLLKSNPTIIKLTISYINIGRSDIKDLFEALKYNKFLKVLNLYNELNDYDAIYMLDMLSYNRTLTKIDFGDTYIGKYFIIVINDELKYNKKYRKYIKIKKAILRKTKNTLYWHILRLF